MIFNQSESTAKTGIAIAKGKEPRVEAWIKRENTMKKSILIHTFVALAMVATLPMGATAATPKKEAGGSSAIEKVHPTRKHYFAHNWLDS